MESKIKEIEKLLDELVKCKKAVYRSLLSEMIMSVIKDALDGKPINIKTK